MELSMSGAMIWGVLAGLFVIGLLALLVLIRIMLGLSPHPKQESPKSAGVRLGAKVEQVISAQLPSVLAGCRIERLLGRGSMGIVYLGQEISTGRTVALKTMALAQDIPAALGGEAKMRFLREAEAATRLRHSAIVQTYGAGEDQQMAWISMEFFPGKPLSDWTEPEHLLPLPQIMAIVRQMALALDHAHNRQVVHRDIKPANILYDPVSCKAKLSDFGVARLTDASRTLAGMVLGTPAFMSPEQLNGTPIDGRSDLYSLGVVFYQLTTGQLPFSGQSLSELMQAIQYQNPMDPRIHQPKLPAGLVRIIMKALQKNVTARFQNGAQLALALARLEAAQKGKDLHA